MSIAKVVAGFSVLAIFITLTLGIGWCINIVKFCSCDFKAPYKAEILRGVSIPVAPLGGIIGYMKIEDK